MKPFKGTLTIPLVSLLLVFVPAGFAAEGVSATGADRSLGEVDFPVSCNADVQDRFNRAVALLHNMMYVRSEKEFAAVAELDSGCAMAYWGIAMTLLHPLWAPPSTDDLKRGSEAIQKAAALNAPTERERDYIAAAQAFYQDWESVDHHTRIAAWENAQERVFANNPEDVDAGALYALAHLATAPKGDKTFSHQENAGALIEKLRATAPRHPGLFHYTIHAYDNPVFAPRALEVAKGYDKIAPEAPHAQHMPSHIFVRLGLWTLTTEWNVRSAEAARRQSESGERSLHYIHAMDYLMYAYLQKAQDKMARETLAEINGVERYQDSFASAYGIAAAQARYPLELRQWAEAARLKPRTHGTFPWDKYPWLESISYFARGLGAARSGDAAGAHKAVEKLVTLHELSVKAGQDYWAVLVDSQRKTVAAWAAYADNQRDEALRTMKQAADLEDSVDKHPVTPGAVLPARELLGDMLMLLGRYNEAVDAYETSLRISPNRFNSLYGAGRAAERGGDMAKARGYYSRLVEIAADGDSERPRLERAKEILARN